MSRNHYAGVAVALLLGVTLTGTLCAQPPKAKAKLAPLRLPVGVKLVKDLDYAGDGIVRHKLDLMLPESTTGPLPLVVWIHGGAWQGGSKEGARAAYLSGRGFVVASINYRLTDAGPFPIQIADCRAAIRWLRANAAAYHIDPDRIGVWGGSAGGHLVALLGTAGDQTEWDSVGGNKDVSARVQAVCDYFGHTDFMVLLDADRPFPAAGPIAKLMGGNPREKRDVAQSASAVTFVSKDDPPFLIVHGDKDTTVPFQQSQILYDKLKEAGVEAALVTVKNGPHGLFGSGFEPDTAALNEKVFEFFTTHLKRGNAAAPASKK